MENSEQLVGIKVARLLKVLGFDWEVTSCYNDNPDLKEDSKIERKNKISQNYNAFRQLQVISLPTQSLAQKWLRDKYKINLSVTYSHIMKKHWCLCVEGFGEIKFYMDSSFGYNSYEEALEKGLEIAIEYINLHNNKQL